MGDERCAFARSPNYAGYEPCEEDDLRVVTLNVVATGAVVPLLLCGRHRLGIFDAALASDVPATTPSEPEGTPDV